MTKADLVALIAKDTELTQTKAEAVLKSIIRTIADTIENEGTIQLIGFGSFKTIIRPARTGRNPNTGDAIAIPEKKIVRFIPGKKLRDAVDVKQGTLAPIKKGILGLFKKKK